MIKTEDVGDWRARFATISRNASRGVPDERVMLPGGRARKVARCVEWYGEDWCGCD